MRTISPGKDGERVPEKIWVFRVGKDCHFSPAALQRRIALAGMFEPSSADKKSPGKRLSVWVEALTVADQAWGIMGSSPKNTIIACLSVDAIRRITAPSGFGAMDVEWEQALDENRIPIRQPGAEGHVGISNLCQGRENKTDRENRLDLRSRLADIAMISPVPVPHNIPEDHIRLAAFYAYENSEDNNRSEEDHWIEGIRQLRRRLARQHFGDAIPVDYPSAAGFGVTP
jgi:hypothetical protein